MLGTTIADRIKALAKSKKIPVGKMLQDCGLNKNALSSMQSGGYKPRLDNITKIADYLGCSVDYLLGREESPQPTAGDDGLDTELMALMRDLPPEDFQRAKDFVAGLIAAREAPPSPRS